MVVYFSIIISKSWVVLSSFCIYSDLYPPILIEKATLSESCTRFRDVVQIVRNTDGQGYDADDHRDGKFDGYED